MQTNIRRIQGPWDTGLVLDKHSVRSIYLGDDDAGHPQFETERTAIGEAVFQLKYRHQWQHVDPLARAIVDQAALLGRVQLVVPMPPSHTRSRQPVVEVARAVAHRMRVRCEEQLLAKTPTPQLKNLRSREEKDAVLRDVFSIRDIQGGPYDILLVDDLFHTGASMEAACAALRLSRKVARIAVVALTWR